MRRINATCFAPVLLMLACAPVERQDSQPDFSSGEHVILGDNGFQAACANRGGCAAPLTRADGKQTFSYGELVAFSGDFYATADEIYKETEKPWIQWHRNDVDAVKKNFQKEVETIEDFLHGHSNEEYPDFNTSYAWNYPDYLQLSLANAPHFGFYNLITYVDYHGRALALALQAHDKQAKQADEARKLLTQALFTNAFADHFLTDGFASGHIRDPRVQILEWAKTQNLKDTAAGTLAKIIHDRDGEVRVSGEHGLNVTNARGDAWLTRCDSQLFWQNSMQDPSIRLPVEAVAASVREILDAYEYGTAVSGVYAATQLVPYPAAFERKLVEIFPANMSDAEYDKIIAQMAFYTKIKVFSGVDKAVLKKMTAALPSLMEKFGQDVQASIQSNPLLGQHLPAAYLEAYRHIQ